MHPGSNGLISVECERTFNEVKRNKTEFRTSTGDNIFNSLEKLGINVKRMTDNDLFLKRSILLWKNQKERTLLQPQNPW